MRVDLDANVLLRDGQEAGILQRAVIDPAANRVSHFVVSSGGLIGKDVLVPRDALKDASRDGDIVRLHLTESDLERWQEFIPDRYTLPPAGWAAPAGYMWPCAGYAWPVAYPYAAVGERLAEREADTITVDKGAIVMDRDGDDMGIVEDVLLDGQTGRLEGFVLRVGGPLRDWAA